MLKFIKKFLKRFTILLAAILVSMVLVFSVTMANLFLNGKIFHERKFVKTEVAIKKIEEVEKKIEKKHTARKPNRQKSNSRSPKAGPRFAMNLGAVTGSNGAAISDELVSDLSKILVYYTISSLLVLTFSFVPTTPFTICPSLAYIPVLTHIRR